MWQAGETARESIERAFVVIHSFNRELTTRAGYLRINVGPIADITAADELNVTRFAAQPVWKNNGDTPTKNLRVRVNWSGHGIGREVGTYLTEPTRLFIAPKSCETSEFIEMPGLNALIQDGQAGALGVVPTMLIWGEALYDDVFGNPHFLRWCYRIRPDRVTERLHVSFIQFGDYNRSDEDSD